MKVLIVGAWQYPMYEKALADALAELGHTSVAFPWAFRYRSPLGRLEEKYAFAGPITLRLNRDLLATAALVRPDVVFTWRATSVLATTLRRLKKMGIRRLASYNHDDFSGPSAGAPVPLHHHLHWRHFIRGASCYDVHFVKRQSNVDHLRALHCRNNHIIPMWYIPSLHRPVSLTIDEERRFGCDVTFVGHFEPDRRVEFLRALVHSGLSVRVYGGKYWTRAVLGELYEHLAPIVPAEGEDYARALCGAKVSLVFLSKLNRDTYTRRCFEIPACGRPMLSERTRDLERMFVPEKEACFFDNPEELTRKAKWLVDRPAEAARIARAGRQRVQTDGHDIISRARQMMNLIELSN